MFCSFSSAEALAGYSSENSNNKKKQARVGRWEEQKGGNRTSSLSLPIVPHALSFYPRPSLPPSQRRRCGGGGERVFCSNRVKTLSFQGLIHYIIGRQANFAFARVNYAHSSDVQRLLWSSHHHFPLKPSSASER